MAIRIETERDETRQRAVSECCQDSSSEREPMFDSIGSNAHRSTLRRVRQR